MATSKKKKVEESLAETIQETTKEITNAVKNAAATAAAGGSENDQILKRLVAQHETAILKIYRKGPQGKEVLFTVLKGQSLKDIDGAGGLDNLCLIEGGAGEYTVHVIPPDGDSKRVQFSVSGKPTRMIPKSEEEYNSGQFMAGFGGSPMPQPGTTPAGPFAGMPGFGAPVVDPLKGASSPAVTKDRDGGFHIKEIAAYMTQQSENAIHGQQAAADRMMMMMQQQQQQAAGMQAQMYQQQQAAQQQMMTLIAGMFQNQNQNQQPKEDGEVKVLKEQLAQMQRQQEQNERFRAQERQIEELKRTVELTKVEQSNKSNPMQDFMLPFLTSQQSQADARTAQMMEVMKMVNDRPGEDEKMANLMSTIAMNNQMSMNMIIELAKSGIMGGEDHPIRDALLQGLDGLRDVAVAALSRPSGEEAEEGYEQPDEMPEPQQAPPAQVEAPDGPIGALEAHEGAEEVPQEVHEQDGLSDEDLERFSRDSALMRVIASLQNGDHVSEAVARIYGHAMSGNQVAANWFEAPETVTAQIFELFDMTEEVTAGPEKDEEILLSEALIANMYEFAEYLEANKDPNKWAKTGYQPFRKKGKHQAQEEEAIEEPQETQEQIDEIVESTEENAAE